jgi:hypothetical protein
MHATEPNGRNVASVRIALRPWSRSAALPVTFRACPKRYRCSLEELARSGGPNAMIRQAERQAGDQEARFWVDVLETCAIDASGEAGLFMAALVPSWIQSLRKRLGIKPTAEAIRA